MAEITPFDNARFLIDLATKLQDERQSDGEHRFTPEVRGQIALLEEMSVINNCVYSLFDFEQYRYIFHTENLFNLIGVKPEQQHKEWDPAYLALIEDRKPIETFIALRKQYLAMIPANQRTGFQSVTCGVYAMNLRGKRLRGMYCARPLTFDRSGNVKLSFDSLSDVKNLMLPEPGYWIRFSTGKSTHHWHSHHQQFVAKDIASPREIEFIGLWKSGLSIPEIAAQASVSSYTVKNQLANARQRLLARDNTSLSQLATLAGLLTEPF